MTVALGHTISMTVALDHTLQYDSCTGQQNKTENCPDWVWFGLVCATNITNVHMVVK